MSIKKSETNRFLEILPGALTWITLAGLPLLSFFVPFYVAIFIILFDLFWLLRGVNGALHLLSSFRKLKLHKSIDWLNRCKKLADIPSFLKDIEAEAQKAPRKKREDLQEEHLRLTKAQVYGTCLDWRNIWHVVILPTYRESPEVLAESIESFIQADYPKDRIIVVVALEEREGEAALRKGEYLEERFKHRFPHFLLTVHPDGVLGEARVKGANISYGARQAQKLLDKQGIPYEDVIISAFDADTIVAPNYFAYLTYTYLVTEDRLHASYQPIPVFHNNIWDVPAITRVVAVANSFWQMIDASRPDRLVTFSSHAMPFKTLVDVGFWPADVIPDDSRIFWKCFIHYHGAYRTVPIFTTVSLDAVLDETHWKTLTGQYKQKRRWAYGVCDIAYMIPHVWADRLIPFWKKFVYSERLFVEAHYFRSTASIMIAALGWLPVFFGGAAFGVTVLAINLPFITRGIMSAATLFLIISVYANMVMLPPKPSHVGRWAVWSMVLQWFLVPIVSTIFGSIPAIDAQTRLMLARYMEFWVTPKVRKSVLASTPGAIFQHPRGN